MHAIEKQREYNTFLRSLKALLIETIYKTQESVIEVLVNKICIKNAGLMGGGGYSFIYEGTLYPKSLVKVRGRANKLHQSLRDEMDKIIHYADYDDFIERLTVDAYISDVLHFVNNKKDLINVLPFPMHPIIKERVKGFSSLMLNKTDTEIVAFKQAHKEGSDCLNNLLVMRLLFQQD